MNRQMTVAAVYDRRTNSCGAHRAPLQKTITPVFRKLRFRLHRAHDSIASA
jgi:hypothetical protein